MDLQTLVDRFVLGGMDKQLHVADVLGDRPWTADLDAGTMRFGDDVDVRAELLGSEAEGPSSWLWAWANPAGYGEHVVAAAHRVRAYGEEHDVADLVRPEVPLTDELTGTRHALVAVGLLEAQAYYGAPVGGGTRAYLLMEHPSFALPAPSVPRVVTVLAHTAETGLVGDWPTALGAFAEARGLDLEPSDAGMTLRVGGEDAVRVTLDELGRVENIEGTANPSEPAPPTDRPPIPISSATPPRRSLLGRLRGRGR